MARSQLALQRLVAFLQSPQLAHATRFRQLVSVQELLAYSQQLLPPWRQPQSAQLSDAEGMRQ
jgi:hypothetical protein